MCEAGLTTAIAMDEGDDTDENYDDDGDDGHTHKTPATGASSVWQHLISIIGANALLLDICVPIST